MDGNPRSPLTAKGGRPGLLDRAWLRLERALPDRLAVEEQYRRRNGFRPDLVTPRDLSEKICWMKLHGMTALHRQCADKVAVRDYVRDCMGDGLLAREILVTDDPADLDPERIPDRRFVAKANHDSGTILICRDRDRFDWAAAREKARQGLARDFSQRYREKQYQGIKPRILVEEFIESDDGGDLEDFKIFCFHGEPVLVQVDRDRFVGHRQAFFDPHWRRLPVRRAYPAVEGAVPRPDQLGEMLDAAATLSRPFPFCRVDLYAAQGRIWFGELTFTPDAGLGRFHPPSFERQMGDLLDLDTPMGASRPRHIGAAPARAGAA